MKSNKYNEKSTEEIIKETYQLLEDIESVLGIRKQKIKEEQIRDCINNFQMEMIDRFIGEDSEYITVHISEVTHLAYVINNIISDKWWMSE